MADCSSSGSDDPNCTTQSSQEHWLTAVLLWRLKALKSHLLPAQHGRVLESPPGLPDMSP